MKDTISKNKRIAQNVIFLYFRMLLIMGVTLYTSRIILNQLGVVDYGIYNVVGGIVVMFSFLNGAMSQSTQRFLSFEMEKGDTETLKNTFKAALTVHTIIAIVIFILSETLGLWFLNSEMNIPPERMKAANWVLQFSIMSFVVSIIQVPYNAAIISHERMQVYAYIGIIEVSLKLLVAISLTWISSEKLIVYAFLIFVVTIFIGLSYITYCLRHFAECCFRFLFERHLLKSISSYAAWSTVGSLAWIGKSQGCNLILNIFLGPAINAAYGITAQINNALNSFVQNFTTAVNPQIVKTYASEDFQRMGMLVNYGSKVSFFLLLILSVPILVQTDRILELWLNEVPPFTAIFTKLIIINSLLESFTYCMSTAIQATGKIKTYQIVVGLTTLLNLPIAWIFLKNGFAPFTIFLTSITLSVVTLIERLVIMKRTLKTYFSARKYVFNVFLPTLYVSTALGTIIYILIRCTTLFNNGFICSSIILFAITISFIYLFGLKKDEKYMIRNLFK